MVLSEEQAAEWVSGSIPPFIKGSGPLVKRPCRAGDEKSFTEHSRAVN